MKFCYQFVVLYVVVRLSESAHNCTSFNDKNHGFGCELKNVKPEDEVLEINVMSKESDNKTEADVEWVQIRDSQFENLPKGIFEKFINLEKMMIISSKGFVKLNVSYFDKKIKLILMKSTDLEVIGENSFTGLVELKTLSLNYNNVRKVTKLAFRDLVNVEKIEMVYNKIESFDDDTFENNVNLKLVLLYNNQLKVLNSQLFSRNLKLESLQLQNNFISQIEKGFHSSLTKLTRIDFSSNLCISENIQITRFIQWSSHQYKFKDCYSNYALMKSTNMAINSVSSKVDKLETKVDEAVERVKNDMDILEGKLSNSTALDEIKTDLVQFFNSDKTQMREEFKKDLHNITSHVRTELTDEIEKKVENALELKQEAKQEKLVSDDFGTFRNEFSRKFTFIYCSLFAIFCMFGAAGFFISKKLQIFPVFHYRTDEKQLIDPEN